MTYKSFSDIITILKGQDKQVSKAYKMNIDLMDFVDPYHEIINILIKEIYGDEGYEWFSWFCYENDYGKKDWSKYASYKMNQKGEMELEYEAGEARYGATDEKGNPICFDVKSTYEYLEANYKK